MRSDRRFFLPAISACLVAASLSACSEDRTPEAGGSREATAPRAAANVEVEVEIPATGNLPSDFPSDVPVFPDAEPQHSLAIPGDSMMVTFTAGAPSRDVYEFYETHLPMNGWTLVQDSEGKHRVIAEKDTRSVSILIIAAGASSEIAISITGI